MKSRGLILLIITTLVVIVAVAFFFRPRPRHQTPATIARTAPVAALPPAPATADSSHEPIPADSISPIANELNAPGGSIQRDLQILNEVFVAWQTNFPRQGNPVGENQEITAALTGANGLHFAFVAPTHPAINARGELCDRWGTPFRFHQLSGTQMEIRSAGPDGRFGTADDVQFEP